MTVRNGHVMTVGELSRRTGVPVKQLREYEDLGLIYTVGRSAGNYRLFDEDALWCVERIRNLRSLGLTKVEIRDLTEVYLARPDQPIGPHLAERLHVPTSCAASAHRLRGPCGTPVHRRRTRPRRWWRRTPGRCCNTRPAFRGLKR
jgi:DNA-binding transcriptional MerR regulator